MPTERSAVLKKLLRGLLAAVMVGIGVLHLVKPEGFVKIVPRFLPAPLALVLISGVFEILGGVGLLVPRVRRWASWGLVLLYVAVFPANVNMAMNDIQPDGAHISQAALWLRLPFQIVLIAWAWWVGSDAPRARRPA